MFDTDHLTRLTQERDGADRAYNEALTALDQALPSIPDLPHPPEPYDEHQITALNERWSVIGPPEERTLGGWRGRLADIAWAVVRPMFERQQAFNSVLVDHLNRNVAVHRSERQAFVATLGAFRAELERLESFHARLILFVQSITLYIDTKDRAEVGRLTHFTESGLKALADELLRRSESAVNVTAEFGRRWEALLVRDQRHAAAVDEVRTSVAAVQQTGTTLKRELERLLAAGLRPPATDAGATGIHADGTSHAGAPGADRHPPAVLAGGVAQAAAFNDTTNAYKYVGFENRFRGSEADIRTRQLDYVAVLEGATNVLDIGCGRGEFLDVLRERGIGARGLDVNHEMVEACRSRGLTVDEGDAVTHLDSLPDASLGGLVALQVVEHFPAPYLLRFLDCAYRALQPGAPLILETLNPSAWFAFFEAYLRDITHAWPLHPDTLKYLVVVSGFQHVEVRFSAPYPQNARLQHCPPLTGPDAPGTRNLVQAFNENVDKVNSLMFGYLDYAVVARRG